MSRWIKMFVFLLMIFAIPLAGALELLLNPRVLFLMLVGGVLLYSQPELKWQDVKKHAPNDRYSAVVIMVAAAISQIVPLAQWGYFPERHWNWPVEVIGVILLVGGTSLRIWAIRALGHWFSPFVLIQEGHQLVKAGPYRYRFMRHPSYVGAFASLVGSSLLLNSPIGLGTTLILMIIAYGYRIPLEKRALRARFGAQALTSQESF